MRDWLFEQLANAIVLLRLGWEHGGRWARLAIRYTALVVFGTPMALSASAISGVHESTGLLIFAGFLAIAWVIWAISSPRYQDYLAAGLVIAGGIAVIDKLRDIRQVVESGLRGLRIILLVELGIGAYFFFVPVENDRGLVLGIPILAALMVFSLGLSRGWRLIFLWVPLIVLLGLTLHFFSKEEGFQKAVEKAKEAAPAGAKPPPDVRICPGEPESYNFGAGVTKISLPLRRLCWTGWVTTPAGSSWRVDVTPLGAVADILFWDRTVLTFKQGEPQFVGVKRGIFRLRNQSGAREATVTVT